jgi:hypothetical protein
MAGSQMPAWVPAVMGVVLAVSAGAVWLDRQHAHRAEPTSTRTTTTTPGASLRPPAGGDLTSTPAGLTRVGLRETTLGTPRVSRFAFDRVIPDRVVSCGMESRDGGQNWNPLAPVARPGAIDGIGTACGDDVVADPGGALGSASGRPAGPVLVWAAERDGALYASIQEEGRRPHLFQLLAPGPWEEVPTPGDVRALAADSIRAYAVADMFGRRASDGSWTWTRWPPTLLPRGVTAFGATVVVWGDAPGPTTGVYLVSRDGGATFLFGAQGPRPLWAALDPHAPSDILVAGEDGRMSRLRIE